MKTLNKLIFTLAFFALSLSTGINGNYSTASTIVLMEEECGVSDADIIKYLERFGYVVYSLHPTAGSCDVIADTQYEYNTIVYICKGIIVGHEDVQ